MMRIFYLIFTLHKIVKYLISNTKRYSNILFLIMIYRPKSIMEIGVYKGQRSIEMILAAKIFNKDISYYGFDLFKNINENIKNKELSKFPYTKRKIQQRLKKYAKVKLFEGYTKDTLDKIHNKKIDLIFIDGGHSIQTINNDWEKSKKFHKKNTIIIFDDYYVNDKKIIKNFGCNKIIKKISSYNYKKKFCFFTDRFNNQNNKLNIKMIFLKKLENE